MRMETAAAACAVMSQTSDSPSLLKALNRHVTTRPFHSPWVLKLLSVRTSALCVAAGSTDPSLHAGWEEEEPLRFPVNAWQNHRKLWSRFSLPFLSSPSSNDAGHQALMTNNISAVFVKTFQGALLHLVLQFWDVEADGDFRAP